MISGSALLHAHHGSPRVAECQDVSIRACWVCAAPSTRGVLQSTWQGANFTGQNKVRAPDSSHVCEACVWTMAGRPPDTHRMYTHLLAGNTYHRFNKGDKPAIRAFLRSAPREQWFAAIADSGQKHIVPWAPINPPNARGRVLFEETVVALPLDMSLVDEIADMLTAGATKAEIETGRYEARAWMLCGDALRVFEQKHNGARTSPWFTLALWLAQRDEAVVAEREAREKEAKKNGKPDRGAKRKAPNKDGGVSTRREGSVPRDTGMLPAQALGPDPEPNAERSAPVGERGGVGNEPPPRAPNPDPQQLRLF